MERAGKTYIRDHAKGKLKSLLLRYLDNRRLVYRLPDRLKPEHTDVFRHSRLQLIVDPGSAEVRIATARREGGAPNFASDAISCFNNGEREPGLLGRASSLQAAHTGTDNYDVKHD